MKTMETFTLVNRARLFGIIGLLTLCLAGSGARLALAQGAEERVIAQAQQAIRERIAGREGGRDPRILFNDDAITESRSRTEILVRGTGTFSRKSDFRNNNTRDNGWGGREFTYEAIVNNRNRNRTVSGIRYDWRGAWSGDGRANDRGGEDDYRAQNIYCASDDGRRHTCPINTYGGTVRLLNQKSGSACIQGRSWGFNNTGIWVDRGCRADFEVSSGRGYGNNRRETDRRDNNGGYGNVARPNGRISYSGPIMNRHSDKALDVTEQGMQDGANIQQWSYAEQANQNWEIIDLGNNEVAIVSRHSGRVLTVQGGRDNNGANIIQRGWSDTRQQRWRLEQTGGDYYRIVSVDNGKCLDVTQQGKENGANIQLWDYANQASQQWRLKR